MLRRVPGLVLRYGLPFLLVATALAYPLWTWRGAHPLSHPEVLDAVGAAQPDEASFFAEAEPRAVAGLAKIMVWILATGLLPAFVLARLCGNRVPLSDALALAFSRFLAGTLLVLLVAALLWFGLTLAALGMLQPTIRHVTLVGVAIVMLAVGRSTLAAMGEIIRPVRGRTAPDDPGAYRLLLAFVLGPLIVAYLSADQWVPLLWNGRVLAGRTVNEAFAVLALIESALLALTAVLWAVVWHRCHGAVGTSDPDAVAEAFA